MECLGATDLRPADGKLFGNRGRAPVGELGALVRIRLPARDEGNMPIPIRPAGSRFATGGGHSATSAANEIESFETSMTADSNFAFSPR